MTGYLARPPVGMALLLMVAVLVVGNFAFAAMQGEHGMFRRIQVEADIAVLEQRKAALSRDHERIANLTARLSDTALDLDLLDERARVVLGYLRADEVVIH